MAENVQSADAHVFHADFLLYTHMEKSMRTMENNVKNVICYTSFVICTHGTQQKQTFIEQKTRFSSVKKTITH